MDDSFWEVVARPRRMTGTQRLTEGLRPYDEVARRMLAGITAELSGIRDEAGRDIRRTRLDIVRRLETLP